MSSSSGQHLCPSPRQKKAAGTVAFGFVGRHVPPPWVAKTELAKRACIGFGCSQRNEKAFVGRLCSSRCFYALFWWTHKGSNLGPLPCEGNALPLSYASGIGNRGPRRRYVP